MFGKLTKTLAKKHGYPQSKPADDLPLAVGTKVIIPGVKNAVITHVHPRISKKRPWLYQIEYTVDDGIPDTRRHSQPWFHGTFKVAK